jgi:transcriptional regulator with XRE-family HTH domain
VFWKQSKNCQRLCWQFLVNGFRAENIVGKRIQEACLKFNPPLSQDELATKLELAGWKISRGTLAKIEAGIREVRDYEIVILAKTLKVDVGWLLSNGE